MVSRPGRSGFLRSIFIGIATLPYRSNFYFSRNFNLDIMSKDKNDIFEEILEKTRMPERDTKN